MKNGEKTWEVEIGKWDFQKEKAELEWDPNEHMWKLANSSNSKVICVSTMTWHAKSHYMTQIVFTDAKERKEVFFEILEKKFNEELYYPSPKKLEETAKKIIKLCETVWRYMDESSTIEPEEMCAEELLMEHLSENVKCIHVYYGNGLFFGMKRKRFNKKEVEKIKAIPMRCRENPLKVP